MLFTDILLGMQPRWWHALMWLFGLERRTFHEWLEGLCPCGEFGCSEDEYAALEDDITVAVIAELFPVPA